MERLITCNFSSKHLKQYLLGKILVSSLSCTLPHGTDNVPSQILILGTLDQFHWWYSSIPPSQTININCLSCPLPLQLLNFPVMSSNAHLLISWPKNTTCPFLKTVYKVPLSLAFQTMVSYSGSPKYLRNHISAATKHYLMCSFTFQDSLLRYISVLSFRLSIKDTWAFAWPILLLIPVTHFSSYVIITPIYLAFTW